MRHKAHLLNGCDLFLRYISTELKVYLLLSTHLTIHNTTKLKLEGHGFLSCFSRTMTMKNSSIFEVDLEA